MEQKEIYLERLIEKTISEGMQTMGCVVIEGAKWCGKSTTAERFAKTIVKLQDPAKFKQYQVLADVGSKKLLSGEKPLLFDEWQKIPELWDYIRADIDKNSYRGAFILTGSAKPLEDKSRHSGTGRMKRVIMRTMSLWESKESTGEVSLGELFKGQARKSVMGKFEDNGIDIDVSGTNKHGLEEIAALLCRGGWPASVIDNKANKTAKDYVDTLVTTDVTDVDDIKRNPQRARGILRAYARHISTSAPMTTIQKDIETNDAVLDPRTLDSYINAFEKLFVIEETEAWTPRLRSKTAIRTTNTRHFVDPSIAATLLGATADDLMNDLNTFGLLFENMAIRDLKTYAQMNDGSIFNYHDKDGVEVDAIVHLRNSQWGAIEIKLGGQALINEGAKSLKNFAKKVDDEKMQKPTFLMVLTAADEFAYKRPDGVLVVPLGCLKN
ncbi:MAG: DUF4143 domain-containing protein [Erysipelotrichaceae bacterium]|jgi:predicted AAA+ superfamily ATPase|nr:DUF4143 domain-containing protein [Erysipelotrichaceae bacterium]